MSVPPVSRSQGPQPEGQGLSSPKLSNINHVAKEPLNTTTTQLNVDYTNTIRRHQATIGQHDKVDDLFNRTPKQG